MLKIWVQDRCKKVDVGWTQVSRMREEQERERRKRRKRRKRSKGRSSGLFRHTLDWHMSPDSCYVYSVTLGFAMWSGTTLEHKGKVVKMDL